MLTTPSNASPEGSTATRTRRHADKRTAAEKLADRAADAKAKEIASRNRPKLMDLKPVNLKMDPLVQRKYSEPHAEKLATDFNPAMIGVLEISRRDNGDDVVIDGQHRRGALIKKGLGDLPTPCLVYTGLSIQEEAMLFYARNGANRKPNPVDTYRIRVLAGDPVAVEINDVLAKHGLHVTFGGSASTISAVAALESIYNMGQTRNPNGQGGAKLLDQVLDLSHQSFGTNDRSANDGMILKAFAHLIVKRGTLLDRPSLTDKLSKNNTAGRVLGLGRSGKQITGRALHVEVANVMIGIYNKGRSSRRLSNF